MCCIFMFVGLCINYLGGIYEKMLIEMQGVWWEESGWDGDFFLSFELESNRFFKILINKFIIYSKCFFILDFVIGVKYYKSSIFNFFVFRLFFIQNKVCAVTFRGVVFFYLV